MITALTIAGTDPSGGAGLHADIKTFAAYGVYGMGAVTAIVAQNTRGVLRVEKVSAAMVAEQLEAVFTDIFPDAVKVGMLGDAETATVVAGALARYRPKHVIVDPVLVSTSGHRLLEHDAEAVLRDRIFPLATMITPNLAEAETLCGFAVGDGASMERAARRLAEMTGGAVLVKGGHLQGPSDDLLFHDRVISWYRGTRVDTTNTHGTGCTLSAAIAAEAASGRDYPDAVRRAKRYLTGALSQGLALGSGHGPVDHGWNRRKPDDRLGERWNESSP